MLCSTRSVLHRGCSVQVQPCRSVLWAHHAAAAAPASPCAVQAGCEAAHNRISAVPSTSYQCATASACTPVRRHHHRSGQQRGGGQHICKTDVAARSVAAAQPGPPQAGPTGGTNNIHGLTVDYVLEQLRLYHQVDRHWAHGEICVSGRGKHLGISVTWAMRWQPSGCFYEEIQGKELAFRWGYDGRPSSTCWEMDSSGVSRAIECDDHESVLLSGYIRTGLWLQPHLQDRLDVELLPGVVSIPSSSSGGSSGSSAKNGGKGRISRTKRRAAAQGAEGSSSGAQAPLLSALPGRVNALLGVAEGGAAAAGAGTVTVAADAAVDVVSPATSSSSSSSSSLPDPGGTADVVTMAVTLKGGRLRTKVLVRLHDWRVLGVEQPLCGDVESWEFGEWREYAPGVLFPSAALHRAIAGGNHAYLTDSGQAGPARPPPAPDLYRLPATPRLPRDTTFIEGGGPTQVPVWRAASGHFLVRPAINGVEGGYVVVDTGASGFVVTPAAARSMQAEAFGELHAASIAGKIPARFIKTRSWSLGCLHIASPIMMVMELEGLVQGGPGEVIGIVGYDIFRRAVVEMPATAGPAEVELGATLAAASALSVTARPLPAADPDPTRASASDASGTPPPLPAPASAAGGALTSPAAALTAPAAQARGLPYTQHAMTLHNPEGYAHDNDWIWHPIVMIASLPHVPVTFSDPSGVVRSVLLLLDSGACGADVMLHARAQKELGLDQVNGWSKPAHHFMRGVGGETRSVVKLEVMDLPWVDLAGVRFEGVRCMCAGVGGLDISLYSAGIICGDLLARLAWALDYSGKRIGFRKSAAESAIGPQPAARGG